MIIGIRLHDLSVGKPDEVFEKTREYGFSNVQLVFKKCLLKSPANPLLFSKQSSIEIGNLIKKYNIKVAMLGAYFNPVHSNKKLVEDNIKYFEEHLKYAKNLSCKYVGTETGSFNDDKWTYNPKNRTEEGYQETISVFRRLLETAKRNKTTILMEPAYGHVIYSVDCLKRALQDLNSSYLKVTIDIFNLLSFENYQNYKDIFHYALSTFKTKIKIIHLKDFYIDGEKLVQCGLGNGLIDFNFIIEQVEKYSPKTILIFEGVTGADILPSKTFIQKIIDNYKK